MDTIHRGNAAEGAVVDRLMSAGMHVLVPFGGGLAFDLGAVLPDGSVTRIHVKSGRLKGDCVAFNSCSTDHGLGRQNYKGRADLIAVHVRYGEVFIVPVEECPSFAALLRPGRPRTIKDKAFGSPRTTPSSAGYAALLIRVATMDIALISDTHMPRGARRLPDDCVTRLQAADLILNPGSPTERRRAPCHTMGIATVDNGRPAFELLVLG